MYLLLLFFFVIIIFFAVFSLKNSTSENKQVNLESIYTKDKNKLEVLIDDKNQVKKLDVYYALARLSDLAVFEYPFNAVKDPKGNGYIGVVAGIKSPTGNVTGKAVFLVSYDALNQTDKSKLEKSIKAINGLAKIFNPNIQYAKGYYYLEVLKLIEGN